MNDRLDSSPARPWDEAWFTDFYEATAPALGRYLLRVMGDPATVDDLIQEAYLRLLRASLPEMDEAALRSYLFQTATHLVYDHWRRTRRERRTLERLRDEAVPARPWSPEATDVMTVFHRLSVRERTLLWLAHVEGYDHREIARIVGVRERSVRVLLFRARRKMARLLRERRTANGA
ncbi:MAG: RNA polymerase sigma factor [Acidobacteria bacterium]|nr:RNA polymerase sigma factor [Acidobacteriota bacterium]MDW7985050.1 RNA polymerase sigma factor [Acidobacteriota bacterium]